MPASPKDCDVKTEQSDDARPAPAGQAAGQRVESAEALPEGLAALGLTPDGLLPVVAADGKVRQPGVPIAQIYYVLASLLCLVMVGAMTVPDRLPFFKSSKFTGLAHTARPFRQVLTEPVIWVWAGLGLAVLVLSILALAVVRHRAWVNPVVTPLAAFSWRRVYSVRLWLTDLLVVLWAVWGAQMIWFGAPMKATIALANGAVISYSWISLTIVLGWMIALGASGARAPLVYGEGTTEYGRVLAGSFFWAGLVAIAATMLKLDMARGYVLLAFPLGLLGILSSRKLWRAWLVVKRTRQGLYTQRAVVVAGSSEGAERVLAEFDRAPTSGYTALAIALAEGTTASTELVVRGLPVVPAADAVEAMRALMADSLIVVDSPHLESAFVRGLSWELRPRSEHLVVAPDMLDVAGPRVAMRPVAGLNLLHVDLPVFSGGRAFIKRTIDVTVSILGLIVLSLPFAILAILVKATSAGPAMYHQTRVGLHGTDFVMWKFRSMVAGADRQVSGLEDHRTAGNEVLFKIKDDPRVTRLGRWMRRWSIDELPQLINVLSGTMSLVGPRPPLRSEVQHYTEEQMDRRFLVKPGITGLWQVSGRSDLSWEDSIRLDLYYVENWSILIDVQLLFRTIRAVFHNDGAY